MALSDTPQSSPIVDPPTFATANEIENFHQYLHNYMKENDLRPPQSRILGIDLRIRLLDDENIYLTCEIYCVEKFLSLLNCYAQFFQLQGYKLFIEKLNQKPNDHLTYNMLKTIGAVEEDLITAQHYVKCYSLKICAYPFVVANDDIDRSTSKMVLINHYLYMYQNLKYLERCYRYYHEHENWAEKKEEKKVRPVQSDSNASEEAVSAESPPNTCPPIRPAFGRPMRPRVRPSFAYKMPTSHMAYGHVTTYSSVTTYGVGRPVRPPGIRPRLFA